MHGENSKHEQQEDLQFTSDIREKFIQAIDKWVHSDSVWLCPGIVACAAVVVKYFWGS